MTIDASLPEPLKRQASSPNDEEPSTSDPETDVLTWDGPNDPDNPYNWSLRKKWLVTFLAVLATFITLINGSIITVAHAAINEEFDVSDAVFPHSYWPVTSWALGGGIFSLVVLPIMEDFGIRYAFLATYFIYVCFLIPAGLAKNFTTLIIVRFFSGGCVSILGNTSAGLIPNVFRGDRARTLPMSFYITTFLAASSMGPVLGSAILQYLSWRWIGHLEAIWAALLMPIFIFFLPETRGSAILKARTKSLRKNGSRIVTEDEPDPIPMYRVIQNSIQRPLYMLFTEPVLFIATLWSAFSVGTIYVFTQSVEQVFSRLYGWDAVQAGYVQAAIVIGEILGQIFCVATSQWYYASAKRNTEILNLPIPEARLYQAILGGFLGVSGGMFVYAWTSYSFCPWIAPTIGLAMVGCGTTCVVTSIANYVVDAYHQFGGSAVAAVATGENVFIAFLPLATQSMYNTLGFQWASSLLGFVSLILAAIPIAVFKWGPQIRSRSPFMKEAALVIGESAMAESTA